MAANAFRRAGFDAYSIDGGLTEWDRRGLPARARGRHGRRPLMRAALAAALLLLAAAGRRGGGAGSSSRSATSPSRSRSPRRRATARACSSSSAAASCGWSRTAPSLAAPFADLERGQRTPAARRACSALAFPPDYAASGLAYVFLVSPNGAELQIRELQRSADPTAPLPGPGRLVLAVPHTQAGNHNGGQLAFGPDGLLYAATGDGGGSNDPRTTPRTRPRCSARSCASTRAAGRRRTSRRQPVRQRRLGLRAAQPVALLVRPRDRRPA